MMRMVNKPNKRLGEEDELGEDAIAAIGDLDEEVEEEEVDAVADEEIEEDF